MTITVGVKMLYVCEQLKKVLKIIDLIYYEQGNHFIIVGTDWGHDTLRTGHEHGRALDALPPLVQSTKVFYKLKKSLGINFIVKRFPNIWHIEYAPLSSVRLDGLQERLARPAIPIYTDLVTRTSFLVPVGQTLIHALRNARERFENELPL